MPDPDAEAARAQLEAERARVSERLAALVQNVEDLFAAAELEPPDDEHDPDGTTAYERAQFISMADAARARLAEIDAALDALDRGAYGTCAVCGGPIGAERLDALPGTTRCVRCA
ncbi:TraR/DksA family transcriptional regulator [Actinomarinicola tropica]|uniref:TraR/DksA family transcriptional regulator n=1 Tax=Actinomarinicola tropica TaxID=2789776 RepID=A0A5Q2RGE9_9ACTN|nr:TraR/DksA C4-type zinc finger protein [Actinomarinicola tropica]QGG94714.1 TraR/DksA family transcriptional regulator [Actinomarinicola tropica]